MPGSCLKQLCHFLLAFLFTLAGGGAQADDTEIYFSAGSSSSSPIRPNVLLILDSSGSMDATVSGTGKTRMQLMKEAMVEIINNMQEVNVGLMRFTYDDGGPILYPITYIDDPAATVVSEPDDTKPAFTYTIAAGTDDAQEDISSSAVTTGDPVLAISQTLAGGSGNFTQRVNAGNNDADEFFGNMNLTANFWTDAGGNTHDAARFTGVPVPQGATITSAIFTLRRLFGAGGDTTVSGHAVDNSAAFTTAASDISSRTKTSASVTWNFASNTLEEKEIAPVIQEIVNRPGWSSGNALSIITHNSSGQRRFYSFDDNPSRAPLLSVDYISGGAASEQLTGLRFTSVDIPQGAVITSAKLILTPTTTQTGAAGAQWQIEAENTGNSNPFAGNDSDISDRTTTSNSVTWVVPDTVANDPVTSPELKTIVQEIVGRSDWCGGNALSFIIQKLMADSTRYFHSFEGNSTLAPQLQITYDATAGSPGCYRKTKTVQIASKYDDVEEQANGSVQRTSGDLDISDKTVGLRFTAVEVPQGATILNAYLEVNADGSSTDGNPTIVVKGENADNSSPFTSSINDVTSRALTSAGVNWTLGSFPSDSIWHASPDLKTLIQEIINRSGWTSGNALSLVLGADSNYRAAESYDDNPNQAPKLTITFESDAGTTTFKTVRQRLTELVNDMPTSDWTPIVETFYEAAHYWRGESVRYGLTRDGSSYTRLSHPGSYCDEENDCNGANTSGSYAPYGIDNPVGCNPETNPDSYSCSGQTIKGTPKYISPIDSTFSCQSNYQVLLTDGEANQNGISATIRSEYLNNGNCLSEKTDGTGISSGEECGIDLVKFLRENDQVQLLDNDQTVRTYTIGFNTSSLADATQYLKDIAEAGKGSFFEATTATDLINVFDLILNEVRTDPTSFVAPSLATNAFNRLLSRDEIYFGLFTPSFERSWPGNVKKYNICIDTSDNDGDGEADCSLGEILDQNGEGAIDATTNQFKVTAQSFWTNSSIEDGKETTKGGSGDELTDYTQRIIYTEATADTSAPAKETSLAFTDNPGFQLDINTWDDDDTSHIRNLLCPVPSTAAGSECESLMLWMLGKIIDVETESDTSATTRWTFNDVLHSSPSVITYGGGDIDPFFDRLVVGTNEGGLRFINGVTGKEEWVFIPQEVLDKQRSHFYNSEGDHLYGLDVTPVLRVNDVNSDGFIDPDDGDFVHVYIGMRRGGNFIYALDITPSVKMTSNDTAIIPKFLWRISSATSGFSRLADTWSRPALATISIKTDEDNFGYKEVLIFGGGYDSVLDAGFGTAPSGGNDNLGNAVYIVDPDDGSLVISVGGNGSGADIEVPGMHFSIPSRITVLDTQGDGLIDRLYFGDTGGQVWRIDLGEDIQAGDKGSTVVGQLANISTAGGAPPINERRFFEPPSVVQVLDSTYSDAAFGKYDYVLIGTGNRAHPLDQDVHDRFYGFRDLFMGKLPDNDNNGLADTGYPQPDGAITNANMIDITNTILDSAESTHIGSKGWYFDFDSSGSSGEKVLSAPTTIAGAVFFTTYAPDVANVDLCAANIGGGNAYNFDILSTRAVVNWNVDGSLDALTDRIKYLGGGIPSDVVPVFTKEGVLGIVGIEGGAAQLGVLSDLPRSRTYWYEED